MEELNINVNNHMFDINTFNPQNDVLMASHVEDGYYILDNKCLYYIAFRGDFYEAGKRYGCGFDLNDIVNSSPFISDLGNWRTVKKQELALMISLMI